MVAPQYKKVQVYAYSYKPFLAKWQDKSTMVVVMHNDYKLLAVA